MGKMSTFALIFFASAINLIVINYVINPQDVFLGKLSKYIGGLWGSTWHISKRIHSSENVITDKRTSRISLCGIKIKY